MEKKYNFENIVLLVGANPLPNYVVGKYFLMNDPDLKKIWLVYSEKQNDFGTKTIAERIRDALRQKTSKNLDFGLCPLKDVSNAKEIKNNIETIFLGEISNSIHLNYTGGTKAMAVHVYRAIEKYENIGNKSFSYLDARNFVLIDDVDGIIPGDLRKIINVNCENFSLDILRTLHGYVKDEQQKYPWNDSLILFKNAIEDGKSNNDLTVRNEPWMQSLFEFKKIIDIEKLNDYLDWKDNVIRRIYYNKNKIDKDDNNVRIKINKSLSELDDLPNSNKHQFKELLINIPEEYSIIDFNGNEGRLLCPNFKKRSKTIEYLDGKWFECYIYIILRKCLNKSIPIELNWTSIKPNSKKFELDIVLLNGYQIYGISVTTSREEGLCKSKGFEILHRVNQIGGDEAKAILITCLTSDKVEKMMDDLKFEISEGLLVLGVEDLPEMNLLPKITKFIGLKEAICQ